MVFILIRFLRKPYLLAKMTILRVGFSFLGCSAWCDFPHFKIGSHTIMVAARFLQFLRFPLRRHSLPPSGGFPLWCIAPALRRTAAYESSDIGCGAGTPSASAAFPLQPKGTLWRRKPRRRRKLGRRSSQNGPAEKAGPDHLRCSSCFCPRGYNGQADDEV